MHVMMQNKKEEWYSGLIVIKKDTKNLIQPILHEFKFPNNLGKNMIFLLK